MILDITAFVMEATALCGFLLAAILCLLCYYTKKNQFNKSLLIAAAVLLVEHALAHLFFESLYSLNERDEARWLYLTWVVMDVFSFAVILVIHSAYKLELTFSVRLLFLYAAIYNVFSLLMQLDRNYIGLNRLFEYIQGKEVILRENWMLSDYWPLWDWYTLVYNAGTFLMSATLILAIIAGNYRQKIDGFNNNRI